MTFPRASGILLHPTSLPGPFGIGDLGEEAFAFIDFLAASGQSLWQVLPLGPTGYGDSPYQCFSAFAGNPLLISPARLAKDGLLTNDDLTNRPRFRPSRVDFGRVIDYKKTLLERA
ncbi:MAG TPA: 4-alpha-glucanotransferase, partial [Blastocatellia bacterium]|nr:4-alpha-glucanotransferase [Blastocatellia bacterium]